MKRNKLLDKIKRKRGGRGSRKEGKVFRDDKTF